MFVFLTFQIGLRAELSPCTVVEKNSDLSSAYFISDSTPLREIYAMKKIKFHGKTSIISNVLNK